MVPYPDGLVRAMLLHEVAQLPHPLIHIFDKVETVHFCQTQLAVVVIQTFLGYPDLPRRLLQIHTLSYISWLSRSQMQLPPSFHQSDCLTNRPLLAPHVLLIFTVSLETRLQVIVVSICLLSSPVTHEDNARFKETPRDKSILG